MEKKPDSQLHEPRPCQFVKLIPTPQRVVSHDNGQVCMCNVYLIYIVRFLMLNDEFLLLISGLVCISCISLFGYLSESLAQSMRINFVGSEQYVSTTKL